MIGRAVAPGALRNVSGLVKQFGYQKRGKVGDGDGMGEEPELHDHYRGEGEDGESDAHGEITSMENPLHSQLGSGGGGGGGGGDVEMKAFDKLDQDDDQARPNRDGDLDVDVTLGDVEVVSDVEALSVDVDVESGGGRGHKPPRNDAGAAAEVVQGTVVQDLEVLSEGGGARVSIGGHSFATNRSQRRRSTMDVGGPLAAPGGQFATSSAGPGGKLTRHASMGSVL